MTSSRFEGCARSVGSTLETMALSVSGLMGGDHKARVMISHQGVDHRAVLHVLGRRWPNVVLKEFERKEPAWGMSADDAADLGSHRRGVEPLRVVVMPQKAQRVTVAPPVLIESMAVLV